MEKEQFYLMAYAVAMADYNRALTIAKESKEYYVTTKDNTLASIFEKIENALTYRKNKEYDKEQVLWLKISDLAKNIDNTLSVFAKACYYDAIADSDEDNKAKNLKYHKRVKEEFEKIDDKILLLLVSAWLEELPEKRASIYEKIANEFNKANLRDLAKQALGHHYLALTRVAETPKEKAELHKKAADEFKAGKNDDSYHWAMGTHYTILASVAGSPKEIAELLKKAADEFKAGENDDLYHWAMGTHYRALAVIAESPKEGAELLKKAADEFKAGNIDNLYHKAMGGHYGALAKGTESLDERAVLNKKAANEFKKGKEEELYHKEMAWHYYLSSLLSQDKLKREDLKSKAVKESNWLFIASIALSLSKITKKTEKIIYLIKDAISSYERYLDEKGKKLPTFTIFIDGNLKDEQMVKSVTEKCREYFDTKISPFLKNKPVEVEELDTMIERTDFILMLVKNNVDEILSFEMGLAYTAGKPVVLFVSGDISRLKPIFSKAATITQKLEYAITVLRLFSIIKSGEILKVEKDEKEKITDFLKSIERFKIPEPKVEFKPPFIEEKTPLKPEFGRLRGDKV